MKRFECTEGGSSKFWEISQEGAELTVRFGRIGTEGQVKTTSFPSAEAAAKKAHSLLAEKVGKGYVEVAGGTSPHRPSSSRNAVSAPPSRQREEGIRVILRSERHGEYALTQLGRHVIFGEGPGRSVQTLSSTKAAEEHLRRLQMLRQKEGFKVVRDERVTDESVEPLTAVERAGFEGDTHFEDGRFAVTFKGDPESRVSKGVCEALVSRIEELAPRYVQLLCDFTSPRARWAEALHGATLPSVESFVFDTHFQSQSRQDKNSIGDLDAVLAACPHLKNLFATGDLSLNPVTHAELTSLHLLGNPLSGALLRSLGKSSFPALEYLAISLTADSAARNQSDLVAALSSLDAPHLAEVQISGVQNLSRFLEGLLGTKIAAQLKTLSIVDENDSESDNLVPLLLEKAELFQTLEALVLPLEGVDKLREQLPCLATVEERALAFLPDAYKSW